MQTAKTNEWRRLSTIIAIIALAISSSTAGVVIYQALHTTTSPPSGSTTTQMLTVSKGKITLVGPGSAAYINFTVPGNLISAFLNVTFSGVNATTSTRLSLLSQGQYQKFSTCNCIFAGNYSSVSTTWSSPLSNAYSAQIQVPSSATWTLAFQHEPGNGTNESFNETIILTYTTKS